MSPLVQGGGPLLRLAWDSHFQQRTGYGTHTGGYRQDSDRAWSGPHLERPVASSRGEGGAPFALSLRMISRSHSGVTGVCLSRFGSRDNDHTDPLVLCKPQGGLLSTDSSEVTGYTGSRAPRERHCLCHICSLSHRSACCSLSLFVLPSGLHNQGVCQAWSRIQNLDASSQYPSHGSFATPATRLTAETRGVA